MKILLTFILLLLAVSSEAQISTVAGGTGRNGLDPYRILTGGTSLYWPVQQLDTGQAGQVLTSNGGSQLPTWQTSGVSSKQILASNFADVNVQFAPGKYFAPWGSDFTFNSSATQNHPADSNGNISIISVAGTLKNWYLQVNHAATNDSFVIYKSTNKGASWAATTLFIHMTSGKSGSDLTHTVSCNAGDWLTLFYTSGSDGTAISDATASYEYDPQ